MTRDYILSMIEKYIARQQLVWEAIVELRPDKVAMARFVGRREVSFEEVLALAEQYKDAPYSGHWNKHGNWRYLIHGNGCRLKNVERGEILDWDAPDREVFDQYFFVYWFMWSIQQEQHNRNITEAEVAQSIVELEADGHLVQVEYTKYRLKKINENDQPNEHPV